MNRTSLRAMSREKSHILLSVMCQAKPETPAESLRFVNDHKTAMTDRSLEGDCGLIMCSYLVGLTVQWWW